MTNETLSLEWRQRLSDYRQSGLSVRGWCALHGIPEHRYYYWNKRLSEPAEPACDVDWLPLAVRSASSSGCVTVRVGGATIDVLPGFDPAHLSAVVAVLAER